MTKIFLLVGLLFSGFGAMADSNALSMNLGTTQTLKFVLPHASGDALKVDQSAVDQAAGPGAVDIKLTTLGVNPDAPAVSIAVTVNPNAKSFGSPETKPFSTPVAFRVLDGTTEVFKATLVVNAVYEIDVKGDDNSHQWSVPAQVSFVSHPEGLVVIFKNVDPVNEHRIHTDGPEDAVPHQPEGNLAPSKGGASGGTYKSTVLPSAGYVVVTYYCHVHGDFNQTRTLTFNTDLK